MPEFYEFVSNPGVEIFRHVDREPGAFDEFLDVHQIFGAVRGDYAGGDLELDVERHGQQGKAFPAQSLFGGIGEGYGFGLVVAGKSSRITRSTFTVTRLWPYSFSARAPIMA